MARFSLLRTATFAAFALLVALGLFLPQGISAAPPSGSPFTRPTTRPVQDDPVNLATLPILTTQGEDIFGVKVTSQDAGGYITTMFKFSTLDAARAHVLIQPSCISTPTGERCAFPVVQGYDGYDVKYNPTNVVNGQQEPVGSSATYHKLDVTGLQPGTWYEFQITVDDVSGPIHTFYGQFWTATLGK